MRGRGTYELEASSRFGGVSIPVGVLDQGHGLVGGADLVTCCMLVDLQESIVVYVDLVAPHDG